jgi:hypothetical protein
MQRDKELILKTYKIMVKTLEKKIIFPKFASHNTKQKKKREKIMKKILMMLFMLVIVVSGMAANMAILIAL